MVMKNCEVSKLVYLPMQEQPSQLMLFVMGVLRGAQRTFLVISMPITMVALARNGHMALFIALLSQDG